MLVDRREPLKQDWNSYLDTQLSILENRPTGYLVTWGINKWLYDQQSSCRRDLRIPTFPAGATENQKLNASDVQLIPVYQMCYYCP